MMNYRFAPTSIYKRAHKAFIKKHPELKYSIEERLKLLQENPQDPSLKNHHLTGQLKGLHIIPGTPHLIPNYRQCLPDQRPKLIHRGADGHCAII